MASAKGNFVLGTIGSAAALGGFYAGHLGVVMDLKESHGIVGLAVGGTALVVVAIIGGLVPVITRPDKAINALLLGAVLPAILFAAGIPAFGVPPKGTAGYEAAAKKPFKALWLSVTPVNALLRQRDDAVAGEKDAAVKAARDEAKAMAEKDKAAALARASSEAETAKTTAVADALAGEQAKSAAAVTDARASVAKEREAAAGQARQEAERDCQVKIDALTTQFSQEKAKMAEALAGVDTLRAEKESVAAEAAAATAKAQEALDRVSGIERDLADLKRFAGWIETDLEGVKTPSLRVLGKRLASRDAEERKAAARLLPMCGPGARDLLQKAVSDSDPAVREVVKASLEKLSR